MFYFYLTIKIIAYYSLPYYLFRHRKSHNKLLSFQSFFLLLWLLYLAYLSYLPFIDYYYTNELNVQFIIPNYASYILVVMFAPMPTLFYLFFIPLVSKFRILSIGVGILYLLVSSIIIFGIETFNYQKRVPLEKICYDFHSDTDEKLSCCLKAGYIWQEGFSYFEDIPPGCKKYMNWND